MAACHVKEIEETIKLYSAWLKENEAWFRRFEAERVAYDERMIAAIAGWGNA